ncbi:hypothetical protein GCM10009105_06340 [Dokdonella soli]|uniref:Uncharacterized protein n=2 Tax=Dokdonella soli TaxID=529810 RepID=A0ABN1ICT9_9GAMM
MSSVKQFVGYVFIGAVASVSSIQTAQAQVQAPTVAGVVVNSAGQTVQTPTLVPPGKTAPPGGISYVQTSSNASALEVYTDGFLFCGNPLLGSTPATLITAHEDQSFSPAHPWFFQNAADVPLVSYTGGVLSVNRDSAGAHWTTLICQGVGAAGDAPTGLTDGIFDNGWESTTATNYNHLVNWIPPAGFDWNTPDWTKVPTNPCISTVAQPVRVVETAACAAVTGVRPASTAGLGVRAGTIWTATDATHFTYLFRVDARYGAQPTQAPTQFQLPTPASTSASTAPNGEAFFISDAYDSAFLTATGQYCFLTTLPTALNSSVCTGAQIYALPLTYRTTVSPPPVGSGSTSFYVAVVRSIGQNTHTNFTTPVVGVSILVDPALVTSGGNQFSGDDVAFGFMPGSTGFPWMVGQ